MQTLKKFKFYLTFFLFTNLLLFSTFYFQQNYLMPVSQHSYYIFTTSNYFILILGFISYIQAIRIRNNLMSYLPAPKVKSQLRNNDILYTFQNKCEKEQDRYKPPRTSHCSKDGCTVRFDHHCPWTDNCVGHYNHKAYLIFTTCGFLFELQFLALSIAKYINVLNTQVNLMSENEVSIWMLLTLNSFIFVLFFSGLTLNGVLFHWKNVTYVELLKGTFMFNDKAGFNPNPYDLGLLTNFSESFYGQLWTFWLPTKSIPRYDGVKFPMIPPVTDKDRKELFPNIQEKLKDPVEKTIPLTYDELYERQVPNYKNAVFHYLGQQYTLDGPIEKQSEHSAVTEEKTEGQVDPQTPQTEEITQEVAEQKRQNKQEDSDILAGVYE